MGRAFGEEFCLNKELATLHFGSVENVDPSNPWSRTLMVRTFFFLTFFFDYVVCISLIFKVLTWRDSMLKCNYCNIISV